MSRYFETLNRIFDRRRVSVCLAAAVLAAAVSGLIAGGPGQILAQVPHGDSTALPVETVYPPLPERAGAAIWLDLDRDHARLSSAKSVAALVDTAVMFGFKRIILDVKKSDGSVAFASRRAPRAALDLDVCAVLRAEAEKRGLETVLHFDVLTEGDTRTGKGPAFDNPEWQTVVDVENMGLMPQAKYPHGGPILYANPCRSDVQMYELSVFEDLLAALKPTTVLLDEIRFFSKASDYSDTTRYQFESWIGMGPAPWPDSVIDTGNPRYKLWMTYRVGVICEFVKRFARSRNQASPDTRLALVVPGYYEPSVDLGMSWIKSGYKPKLWFADDQFRRFSLADVVDEMVMMNRDTNPFVVEAISMGSARGTMNHLPLTVTLSARAFAGRPARFRECLQSIRAAGPSVVITDIDGMAADDLWAIFQEEMIAG